MLKLSRTKNIFHVSRSMNLNSFKWNITINFSCSIFLFPLETHTPSTHPHQLLMNSAAPKANEIGHELSVIKLNVGREIAALKNAVSGDVSKIHRMNSFASSSFASSTPIRKASIESIKSATKWNEKTAEISFDDIKFSTIIDDGKKSDKAKHPMMKEIDNASGADCGVTSDNASESMLHDKSFNWIKESVSWISIVDNSIWAFRSPLALVTTIISYTTIFLFDLSRMHTVN